VAGRMDTGMLRHRLGLGLQKIRSSSTKMTKKSTLNLNPSLRSTLPLSRVEMTCLNTIIPCLGVAADRALDSCRPCFPARARVPSSRAVVVILMKGVQLPSPRWKMLEAYCPPPSRASRTLFAMTSQSNQSQWPAKHRITRMPP
jgi:hypothetical protein